MNWAAMSTAVGNKPVRKNRDTAMNGADTTTAASNTTAMNVAATDEARPTEAREGRQG
jgi:hypothetical protein